ncbi:50S ribosomal protein L32 [candidate division KSB1 bacterium]|nr:50S ribosomal protein L32 [candidate division KSB1 bacterium]MCH8285196.1 50S ribosomal protein L32 [candidate division KSB1 bacterium]
MALPKRKTSKSRRDKRRTHWKLTPKVLMECPHCHQSKETHRACPNCGYYNNREVYFPGE